jgi:hypothetical protein
MLNDSEEPPNGEKFSFESLIPTSFHLMVCLYVLPKSYRFQYVSCLGSLLFHLNLVGISNRADEFCFF